MLPTHHDDVITADNRYIEVTLRWGARVTDVKRVKASAAFRVGKDKDDQVFVPAAGDSWSLLSSMAGQRTVRFKPGMSGLVRRGATSSPLSSSAVVDGDAMAVWLHDDTVVDIVVGDHSLQVRVVPKSPMMQITPLFDALWANAALITLFAASALLAAVIFYPVGMDSLDDDLLTNPTRFQQVILKAPPKDSPFLQGLKGKQTERKRVVANDAAPKKSATAPKTTTKQLPTDEEVVATKLAGLFGGAGVASVFQDGGSGAMAAAVGSLDGVKVAAAFGSGSLGVRGVGVGVGVGTIGAGKINTRGRTFGDGSYGVGGAFIAKQDHEITMTNEPPHVVGSLDPDIIRRIVRDHAGQIRYCYESALARTPGIGGKVTMKWVINADGKVTQASTGENQMHSIAVEGCLASRIKTWTFPRPKGGGIVVVNYPFVFKQTG